MLLWLLVAAAALLLAGGGHASAAQRSPVAHRAGAVHGHAVAYADGSLTVARRHAQRRHPVAHARVRTLGVSGTRHPVAYADGKLTAPRHSPPLRRRILTRAA
jgi:hypothetical protein